MDRWVTSIDISSGGEHGELLSLVWWELGSTSSVDNSNSINISLSCQLGNIYLSSGGDLEWVEEGVRGMGAPHTGTT